MNTPEFDPRRSAAIRSTLEDVVASTPGVGASARPRPSRRTAVLVALAVVVGLIASGTTAVALTGGSLFGLGDPVAPVATATTTPTPTATPTPTPTATPTVPPPPPAPVVRVPATCDQLLPQSAAEGIVGGALTTAVSGDHSRSPVSFVGDRVGELRCSFSDDGSPTWQGHSGVMISVVPDVSAEAFAKTAQKEGVFVESPEPGIGPHTYSACADATYQARSCSFITWIGGYGLSVSAVADGMTAEQRVATREQFIVIRDAVAALGAPGPLWQPVPPSTRSAIGCDELVPSAALAAQLGVAEMREFKSMEGEYNGTPFFSNEQVGAYFCSWSDTDPAGSASVSVALLPGGAGYRGEGLAADPSLTWQPAPDYPGDAAVADTGGGSSTVSIAIDGDWLMVSAPTDSLRSVTDLVISSTVR